MNTKHVIVRRPGGLRVLRVTLNHRKVRKVKRLQVETSMRGLAPGDQLCRSDRSAGALVAAWERLQKATLSQATWRDLLLVLSDSTAAPVRCVDSAPRLHAECGADIRRWLCDPIACADLLDQLREQGYQAQHANRDAAAKRAYLAIFPDTGAVNDPHCYFRHHTCRPLGESSLSGVHWERVVPWLRGVLWVKVPSIVACWEELYRVSPDTAWAALAHTEPGHLGGWLDFFLNGPKPHQRDRVLRSWLAEEWYCRRFPGEWRPLVTLAMRGKHGGLRHRLHYVFTAHRDGADRDRVYAALALWDRYQWEHPPRAAGPGRDCSTLVERLTQRVPEKDRARISKRMFTFLGEHPCQEFFETLLDHRLPDPLFDRLFVMARRFGGGRDHSEVLWSSLTQNLGDLADCFKSVPEQYIDKAQKLFQHLYWESAQAEPNLNQVLELISTLCRSPMARHDEVAAVLSDIFDRASESVVRYLASLPGSTWRRVDDACRSWTRAESIHKGLGMMQSKLRPLVILGLTYRVRRLMRVLETLGGHTETSAQVVLERCQHHPLYGVWLRVDDFADHLALLEHSLGRASRDPLAKLKEIHDGRRPWRREVVAKFVRELRGLVIEELLHWLDQELHATLRNEARLFGGTVQDHTMQLMNDISGNRRVFRRVLRGYVRDGDTAIWGHELNRRWLKKHPDLLSRGWLRSHEVVVETLSGGALTVRLEQRFEEVLKMGTLVHSCLAVGGCCSYAAVANALDANKQVALALDQDGEVVGRQLLGISNEGRLVCFEVYPRRSLGRDLDRAFAAYDRHLASTLGLPLRAENEDYAVEQVVCREWYDDYAWSPQSVEPARILKIVPDQPAGAVLADL